MPWIALPIQTDATPDHVNQLVQPTANNAISCQVHAVLFEALPTNQGRVVFGDRNDIVATTVGGHVTAMLPPPTTNIYPSANAGIPFSPAGLDLRDIWWCVEHAGDGFTCSYLV